MTAQLSFPVCCLPGCKAIVAEWGDACATCQNEVADQLAERNRGTMLGRHVGIALDADQVGAEVMQAYTDQAAIELADTTTEPTPAVDAAVQWLAKRRIEDRILIDMPPAVVDIVESVDVRKANQLCWLCEERRTCTHIAGRWECDKCREVQ